MTARPPYHIGYFFDQQGHHFEGFGLYGCQRLKNIGRRIAVVARSGQNGIERGRGRFHTHRDGIFGLKFNFPAGAWFVGSTAGDKPESEPDGQQHHCALM